MVLGKRLQHSHGLAVRRLGRRSYSSSLAPSSVHDLSISFVSGSKPAAYVLALPARGDFGIEQIEH